LQGGSDFSVNGNPSTNNLFLIDGVNNNDVGSNRTILSYPSVDAVAEFRMLTNSYGPEYGQASGAIISITTRSGENSFHGGAFYEGRNDALNAAGFIANLDNLKKPELRRNDWGYYVAGPIKKDKLFFWWNEEWNRDIRGAIVTQCVPTAAERGGDFSADVNAALSALNGAGPTTVLTQNQAARFRPRIRLAMHLHPQRLRILRLRPMRTFGPRLRTFLRPIRFLEISTLSRIRTLLASFWLRTIHSPILRL